MKKSHKQSDDGVQLALFEPSTGWKAPTEFPDFSNTKEIGLDLETRDPKLKTKGPGTHRRDGYPVGISVSDIKKTYYYPIAHASGQNCNKEAVAGYFRKLLSRRDLTVVGANILYDAEWLAFMEIPIEGKLVDIQNAECLLDEEADDYSLGTLCQKYLGKQKNEDLLNKAADAYGLHPKQDLWKLKPEFVGPYAEADAADALAIWQVQKLALENENLMGIFELECKLTPILLKMRQLGVRVDKEKARAFSIECDQKISELQDELDAKYGFKVNVNSPAHLASICDREGWKYPRTEKTKAPSFDKLYFKHARSSTMKKIARIRQLRKLKGDYVDKLILDFSVGDRIYATFNQMARSEEDGGKGGTRTGRFSSSRPNLQQVPSRDELAPVVRGFFIPERDHQWAKLDYSQQEPRILVHYAVLMGYEGAQQACDAYYANRAMDYYQFVADQSNLERKPAKDLTLGIFYGEGKRKIAKDLNMEMDAAVDLLNKFQDRNPYVRDMYNSAMKMANKRGYIRTLLGRHRHFVFWEPADCWAMREEGKDVTPVRLDEARLKWPGHELKRAFTYKALNALIQGSAADMTKAAMLAVYDQMGLVPHMQVHDELNYSVKNRGEAEEIKRIMENCVELKTLMLADLDLGSSWK